jgi:hypothetical protein
MDHIETPSSSLSVPVTPIPQFRTPSPSYSVLTEPQRLERRRIHGKTWQLVGNPANIRRNSVISAIWAHGTLYEAINSRNEKRWICDYCSSPIALKNNGSTFNVSRHLLDAHKINIKRNREEAEEEEEAISQDEEDLQASIETQIRPSVITTLISRVNIDVFRRMLVEWVVQDQIPFSAVKSKRLRDLFLLLQPSMERYLITSHTTMSKWVQDDYHNARVRLKSILAKSQSRIHISFDAWTSPSDKAILGVSAHFLSTELKLQHALIGFKEIEGVHDGENLAEYVIAVIQELELEEKFGVFVGDNAGNVDTAINAIVRRLRPNEPPGLRRSRCLGHIINLAAKAFIHGADVEAWEDEVALAAQRDSRRGHEELNLMEEQVQWRSRGPIGKYHNVVVFIRASPQRRQAFKQSVCTVVNEANERGDPVDFTSELTVILDNCTRWNSTYSAIERGLKLKRAIQLFLIDFQRELPNDLLQEEDWDILKEVCDALAPFYYITKRLEGRAENGTHGVIWEALPMIDYLMNLTETQKTRLETEHQAQAQAQETAPMNRRRQTRNQLRINPLLICYQNAWQKLTKYNRLTDENHEIYAAATLLNPCLRKHWFTHSWTGTSQPFIEQMLATNRKYWESNYPIITPEETPLDSPSIVDTYYMEIQRLENTAIDEFTEYTDGHLTRYRSRNQGSNLFKWWFNEGPISLRQWAFDSLSVPAMSAEIERGFSQARRIITIDRNRMSTEALEASLCYKHWLDTGILDMDMADSVMDEQIIRLDYY